jgi:hypothetical protein
VSVIKKPIKINGKTVTAHIAVNIDLAISFAFHFFDSKSPLSIFFKSEFICCFLFMLVFFRVKNL